MSIQKFRQLFYLGLVVFFGKIALAAPVPITDLVVISTGFKHLTISWSAPYDIAPTSYAIHISSWRVIVTTDDWENNSSNTSYPWRIYWATNTTPGQTEFLTIAGLNNNQSYFLAIRSSTDGINWSDLDTTSPEPWGTPTNSNPGIVFGHNPPDGTIVNTSTPTLSWSPATPGSDDSNFGDYIQSYTLWYSTNSNFNIKSVVENIPTNSYITPPLSEDTTYYWKVFAVDSEGLTSASAISRRIIVNAVNSPPANFSLTYPISSQIINDNFPTFQWTNSTDIDPGDSITYTLIYSTDANFNSICSTTIANLVNNYSNPSGPLLENACYFWYVKAIDTKNTYTLSNTTETFWVNTINEQPQSFSQVFPASSTVILISRPTFYWEVAIDPDPADTVTYAIIYSSSDPNLTSQYNYISGLTTNYYYPSEDLVEDATYYWKVQATDTKPQTTETLIWSFVVNAINDPPNSFNLVTPSGTITTPTPNFVWENNGDPDNDPIKYNLYYSTDSNFNVTFSSCNIPTNQLSLSFPLTENATYYWKVSAYDTYGNTTSANQTFILRVNSIEENPTVFNLVSPVNSSQISSLYPLLQWEVAIDPDPDDYVLNYTLFYSTDPSFSSVDTISTPNTYYNFLTPLNNHTTYYWYVRANSKISGESFSATTNYFIIKNVSPNNFNLITPSGTITTSTPNLIWQIATDPDNDEVFYTVYYSTDSSFSTYFSSAGLTTNNYPTPNLSENTTYYWKVIATDSLSNSTTSNQVFKFITNYISEAPGDFSLISPKNTNILTRKPKFFWQATTDPDPDDDVASYTFYLWKENGPLTVSSGITQTNYSLDTSLDLYSTYYWNVSAVDRQGLEKFSTTAYFYIAGVLHPQPVKITLDVFPSSVTIKWDAISAYEDGTPLSDLSGYAIYRANSLSDIYSVNPATFIPKNQLSWTDTDTAGRSLYYWVCARDNFGSESNVTSITFKDYSNIPYRIITSNDENIYLKVRQQIIPDNQEIIISTRTSTSATVLKSWEIEYYLDGQKTKKSWDLETAPELNIQLTGFASVLRKNTSSDSSIVYQINWFNGVKFVPVYRKYVSFGEILSFRIINTGEYQLQTIPAGETGILSTWPKIITPKNADGINDEFNVVIANPESLATEGIIYDLSGAEISRMKNRTDVWLYWDGRDKNNQICLPGVYLYQIKIGTKFYNGTLVIAQ